MTNTNYSLSNIFESILSLEINKIYGWDTRLWIDFLKSCKDNVVKEWIEHIERCINEKNGYSKNYESIKIKNEIESFSKRSQINSLFYAFLNSK